MRFPPHFLDEIRARLPVSAVVSRKVALKKKGREWAGLSPFKSEKSASFFVNDQKGFYHCFASGEHGDIFTFLMKTEGLAFPEAVERLAADAGVPMPVQTLSPNDRPDERPTLYDLIAKSAEFFRDQLMTSGGADARRYLEKRGLNHETIQAFGIGYAPQGRSILKDYLAKAGFSVPDAIASGMLIGGDDIPVPYDRFRNRVMFPICDLKGRPIAFGGRALDANAPAKYLNSPETPLFHKGGMLFNANKARALAHDRDRIVVVEGYMDVVALTEAGIGECVAPLGTALTEDQIKLLWRFVAEPTLCFDGDSAGRKAAWRAVDTILPLLKPGYSVQFVFLPPGLDPDDLVRQHGASGAAAELSRTKPLFDVMWERELERQPLDTPEQRAAFETRVKGLVAGIADTTVRGYYEQQARQNLYSWSRSVVRGGGGQSLSVSGTYAASGRGSAPHDWKSGERSRLTGSQRVMRREPMRPPRPAASRELTAKSSSLPAREALLLKTVLNHPRLIDDHAEILSDIAFTAKPLADLRDAILEVHALHNLLDTATLRSQLSLSGNSRVLELVAQTITHKSDRFAEPEASIIEAASGWQHVLALHQRHVALQQSLEAARKAWDRDGDEDALARIMQIQRELSQTGHSEAPE